MRENFNTPMHAVASRRAACYRESHFCFSMRLMKIYQYSITMKYGNDNAAIWPVWPLGRCLAMDFIMWFSIFILRQA